MSNIALHIQDLIDRGLWVDYRGPIWGDSYNWSWNRKADEVKYVVIHHSVTSHDATPDDIALLHKARGWGGIGYHFVITKNGTVYYVGDVGTARANVLNMNEKVIGICLIGDFTKHLPSDEQIVSAHYLCKFFIDNAQWPNVKSWEDIVGHKELQATACPGTSWKGAPDSMYWRIQNKYPYSPQQPPEEDDWAKLVQYLEIPGDPNQTTYEDVRNVIGGYKSRITDLQKQIPQLEIEVKNREEQVSRLNSQLLAEKKLYSDLQKELEEIIKKHKNIEASYEGRINILQGQVDTVSKEKGALNTRIAVLETEKETLKNKVNELIKAKANEVKFWE